MECFIVDQSDVREETRSLDLRGDEAHHAIKVLRLREGNRFLVTNLLGTCYECEFEEAIFESKREELVRGRIVAVFPDFGESTTDAMLIQGMIAKQPRWEFLIEKATELGVRVIVPVSTERTERHDFRLDRSDRVLRSAVKQTKRANKPWLVTRQSGASTQQARRKTEGQDGELSSLREALSDARSQHREIILLHEAAPIEMTLMSVLSEIDTRRIALVVGPEGGFTDDEVTMATEEFGAHMASLSKRRLRAETAAIAALAIAIRDV